METNKQENIQQENTQQEQTTVQLVLPQATLDEIAELEKKYRETIERENK